MGTSKYILVIPLLIILTLSLPATVISNDSKEKVCPVHHVSLKKERVAITYGLVDDPCYSLDRIKSRGKYFPYANSIIHGGDIIYPDSPEYKDVRYCETCREVEKNWPCMEMPDIRIITTLPRPGITKLPTLP